MPKLDSNIYGADNNGFAQRISADALANTSNDAGSLDNSAMSHGTSKGTSTDTNPVVVTHDKSDGRAKTAGNHGAQS